MKKMTLLGMILCLSIHGYSQNLLWTCGDELVDSRDGKTYNTVLIGSQCWMAENLNYGTMINSTAAGGQMSDNAVVEKYCWDNVLDNCDGTAGADKLGAFYEWNEAVQSYSGQPSLPVQGVCPDGWHIPSQTEFNDLMTELGGSNMAGGKMKEGGSSGYEGILTGYRCTMSGSFRKSALGTTWSAYYWAAEQSDASNAYFYELSETNNVFSQCAYSPFYITLGNSIRCIKNQGTSLKEKEHSQNIQIKQVDVATLGSIRVTLWTNNSESYKVRIVDMNGREVFFESFAVQQGENTFDIQLKNTLSGIYCIQFLCNTMLRTEKILII
ncbi:FISUMP domain-containing protein [Bacteroidota bacterium]